MKRLLLLLFFIPFFSSSQENKANSFDFFQRAGADRVRIDYKPEHKGTPYLYDHWKKGYIIINDSIISSQEKIQFNLETGELIIGSGNGKGIIITDNDVTGFGIDKGDNITNINRRIFAKVNSSQFKNSENRTHFYEVISNLQNTNFLLKDVKKYLFDPNKSRGYQTQNSIPQEYKEKANYYIKNSSGKYIKTKLKKKNILKLLNDKDSEVNAFVVSNKINFKKEHDVVKLLDYYHKL